VGCPALNDPPSGLMPCNTHNCSMPECQLEHVRCHVKNISHHNSWAKRLDLPMCGHSKVEDTDKCWEVPTTAADTNALHEQNVRWGRTGWYCRHPLTQGCHSPDDANETALGTRLQEQYEACINGASGGRVNRLPCRNKFASIVVTHDRLPYYNENSTIQRNAFHCARTPGTDDECTCRCNQHTECCSLQDKVLGVSSTAQGAHAGINSDAIDSIAGNRFLDIDTKQECCDLCTNHPQCTGWVYDSENVCLLKQGTLTFVDNAAADQITTWAGRPSGIACTL